MAADPATYHWFWMEAINRLESLRQRVLQGQDYQAALEFSTFVINSGMHKILLEHDSDGMLKVDSAFLAWKAEDLRGMVWDAYRSGKVAPGANQDALRAIAEKLDLIAGHVAKLTPSGGSGSGQAGVSPALVVLPGGVS